MALHEEARMVAVGIRELKNRLSQYLKRVGAGERVVVTERGQPVAVISPPPVTPADRRIEAMLRDGVAQWGGGKPRGASAAVHGRLAEPVVFASWVLVLEKAAKREGLMPFRSRKYPQSQS